LIIFETVAKNERLSNCQKQIVRGLPMKINLIPTSPSGVSYGGHVTNAAIQRFRPYLLGVVVVAPSDGFEFDGDRPTPENITKAELNTVITLFREPNTIGQVTGFIHLKGMNINVYRHFVINFV
jgi:hypothetical protein